MSFICTDHFGRFLKASLTEKPTYSSECPCMLEIPAIQLQVGLVVLHLDLN